MPTLSPEQSAFKTAAQKENGENLILISCAGSGKTTAICEAAAGENTAVFAFNKNIAKELQTRLPTAVTAATTHSAGYSAWARHAGKKLTLNERKTWQLAGPLLGDLSSPDLARAVGLAKNLAYIPSETSREELENFLSDHNIEPGDLSFPDFLSLIDTVLEKSLKAGFKGEIDYDDMIYLPAIHGARILSKSGKPFRHIFCDESQDQNAVQRLLFQNAKADRYSFVGDPGQSIYGFRGADHKSMENLQKDFSCRPLSLTVSYRCPQEVVKAAQRYHVGIFPHSSAPMGIVSAENLPILPGDAILCRNNAPLIKTAFSLLSSGIPVTVVGRDIGASLISVIKKNATSGEMPLSETLAKIEARFNVEMTNARLKQNDKKLSSLQDKLDCIFAISDFISSPAPTARDLVKAVENIFSDSHSPITLSTVHKAKGKEWSRVHILAFSLIGKYASTPESIQQERNLAYVAITRAKNHLNFIPEGISNA